MQPTVGSAMFNLKDALCCGTVVVPPSHANARSEPIASKQR